MFDYNVWKLTFPCGFWDYFPTDYFYFGWSSTLFLLISSKYGLLPWIWLICRCDCFSKPPLLLWALYSWYAMKCWLVDWLGLGWLEKSMLVFCGFEIWFSKGIGIFWIDLSSMWLLLLLLEMLFWICFWFAFLPPCFGFIWITSAVCKDWSVWTYEFY